MKTSLDIYTHTKYQHADAHEKSRASQLYQDYLDVCDRINKCRDLYEIRNLGYESQKMIKVLVALGKLPESAL